jgi:integrase
MLEERYNTGSNYDNWFSALRYIKLYSNNEIKFKDLTPEFVEGFKNYLLTAKVPGRGVKLSQNSCVSYFNKFRAAINNAFELRKLEDNPVKRVKSIKQAEANRQYLTVEELKRLKKTDCKSEILKQAFLFSCLTGLRWSDVNNLKWKDIERSKKLGTRIIFRQVKTDGQEYLPINEQALEYLPDKGKPDDRVFEGLKYSAEMNIKLAQWVLKAGITKTITFHCARHTNAVLLLSNGVGIETVSKMLGHRDLKTTQIYAKVVDEMKQRAVNLIPQI